MVPNVRRLNSLNFSGQCFVRKGCETIRQRHETIFRFWRRYPETADGYHVVNETGAAGHG